MHLKSLRSSSLFAKACLAATRGQVRTTSLLTGSLQKSSYSTSPTSPIYELRLYQTHPHQFKAVNEVFNEHMDLRTRHSKLTGFWTAEIGDAIQQFVHIWEYESLSQRASVRKAIAADTELFEKYLSIIMPKMIVMKSHLVVPAVNTQLDLDFSSSPTAVYVLQTVSGVGQHATVPKSKVNGEKLVGRLTSLLGPGNTEFRLWRYENIDSVTEASEQKAQEAPTPGSSMLLYPTPFSPMK